MRLISKCKDGKTWVQVSEDFYSDINFKKGGEIKVHSPLQRLLNWKEDARTKGLKMEEAFCDGLLANTYSLFKRLFVDPSDQLSNLISDVNALRIASGLDTFYRELPNGPAANPIGTKVLNMLDYSSWSNSNKSVDHFTTVDIKVCVYCNQKVTWLTNNGKKVYTWDHYYEKSRHPFLALSVSNLIPSCHSCNSTFKTTKSFSTDTHLHPYIDDYDVFCKINADVDLIKRKCEIKSVKLIVTPGEAKIIRTNHDLDLKSRYQSPDIIDQIKQLWAERSSLEMNRPKEVAMLLGEPLFIIKAQWYERMGINFTRDQIRNKRLGKLKLDIAKQFGLI